MGDNEGWKVEYLRREGDEMTMREGRHEKGVVPVGAMYEAHDWQMEPQDGADRRASRCTTARATARQKNPPIELIVFCIVSSNDDRPDRSHR
jgi:hypothetical protein